MDSQNRFGIDHPLVAVKDMQTASEQFAKLGFYINPRHHHPWGTDNHLLMFPSNFVEVISVYDETKLDQKNDNGFAFGRFVATALEKREGIALVALNSKDARADYQRLVTRGVENDGIVDFKRVAHKPDGSEEEAVVSLVMLVDSVYPSLSNFLCHQHKPHLVWVKEWMTHPNHAVAITKVSYVVDDLAPVIARYSAIYGESAISQFDDYFVVATASGVFEFLLPSAAQLRFDDPDMKYQDAELPIGVAITIATDDLSQAEAILQQNSVTYSKFNEGGLRVPASFVGNTIFEFVAAS